MYQVAVKRFGGKAWDGLKRGMYRETHTKRMADKRGKGSLGKSLFETILEKLGLPEAGGVLQSQYAGRRRRVVFARDCQAC